MTTGLCAEIPCVLIVRSVQVLGHLGRMALMDGAAKVLILDDLKAGQVKIVPQGSSEKR